MFLSTLEEHRIVKGTSLFSDEIHLTELLCREESKQIKTKRKDQGKTKRNSKKSPKNTKNRPPQKNKLRIFCVNYFHSPCSKELLCLEPLHTFHLCVLLVHTMGFMRKSVHPQDSLLMKYEGGPEDFIWSGYGSLTTSEVLM